MTRRSSAALTLITPHLDYGCLVGAKGGSWRQRRRAAREVGRRAAVVADERLDVVGLAVRLQFALLAAVKVFEIGGPLRPRGGGLLDRLDKLPVQVDLQPVPRFGLVDRVLGAKHQPTPVANFLALRRRGCLCAPPTSAATSLPLARLAVGTDSFFQLGNFPSYFLLVPDGPHGLVVGPDQVADLPIRLLRVGLQYLRDQFALLLGREVPAVDVGGDHEGGGIIALEVPRHHLDAGLAAGAIPIAAVEDFVLEDGDGLAQAVRLDVGDQLVELGALHQREDVGERVKLEPGVHGVGSPARSSIRSSARTGTRNSLPILTTGISPRAAAS